MGLQLVDQSDHILCSHWEQMAEETGLHFVASEHIHTLFDDPQFDSTTLVSGYSDYGIHEQESSHPNADLVKWAQIVPWDVLASRRDAYQAFQLGPTCRPEWCDLTHKYSIKIDRHTIATFADVPQWVKRWYCVNLNVEHPRMEWLPFGLNNDGPGWTYMSNHFNKEKTGLLYVNFQPHTSERAILKQHYSNVRWATHRPSAQMPVDEYLHEVAAHKFVLCPFGNGMDCYRVYEAIYLNSIPILPRCRLSQYMSDAGLPVLILDRLHGINEQFLNVVWEQSQQQTFDYSKVTLSYWRRRFQDHA